MTKAGQVKVELRPMSLKSITPPIPRLEKEKEMLVEDLTKMGYKGLLLEPWSLKSKAMVQEFQGKCSNKWEGTIRRDSEYWTANLRAEVYGFQKEGRMRVGRTKTWVNSKFKTSINPKDGHAVCD